MTPQTTFMIMATIKAGYEESLRKLLASMNSAPGFADPDNDLMPFGSFSKLHVARFVIVRANTNDDIVAHGIPPEEWSPKLAFLGDIDGELDTFLAELVIRAGAALEKIFDHCEGFDTSPDTLLRQLHTHNISPSANYQNWRGRTVKQVLQEQALTVALEQKLSEYDAEKLASIIAAGQELLIHRYLGEFVKQQQNSLALRLDPDEVTPAGWWVTNLCHLVAIPLLLIALAPLFLLAAPVYFWYLRKLERGDPENLQRADQEHLYELINQEDIDVTNHFNVFGQVKPGVFRRSTIRFLLLLLDYASRHVYHCGFLARIQTIHFARWVLLDNNKRVYFASNYDGSADSYMDDFINKVAWGLNLVFSNGVGYPRTRYLIKKGAENEGKYKKTLRRNQLPSESWYKAYPGLTAVDIARNSRIRRGMQKENPSAQEVRQWLSLLKYKQASSSTGTSFKEPPTKKKSATSAGAML